MTSNAQQRIRTAIKTLKNQGKIKDQSELATSLGYKRAGSISDILKSDSINIKFIKLLCETYGISEEWIAIGEGEMFGSRDESDLSDTGNVEYSPSMKRIIDKFADKYVVMTPDELIECIQTAFKKSAYNKPVLTQLDIEQVWAYIKHRSYEHIGGALRRESVDLSDVIKAFEMVGITLPKESEDPF